MNRASRLERNSKLLFLFRAFTEVKILNAIVVLFYLARGVTYEQVFLLTIVFSVGTLLFEIPSGYLADKIGRKKVLIIGAFAVVGVQVVSFFAFGFWELAVVQIFVAIADSMFSGTEEALVYDSLKEIKKESLVTKVMGRLSSSRHITKIIFPTIGAIIAKDLLEWQFDLIIGINLGFSILAVIVLLFILEPKHKVSLEEEETGVYIQSLTTIWKQPFLLRAAMNKILIFVASVLVWRVYQPYMLELGVTVVWLGIFYVFLHGGSFLLKWNTHKIAEKFGVIPLLGWTAVVFGLFSLAVAWIQWAPFVFIATLVLLYSANARIPLFPELMNKLIHSRSRATTLSNLNVFKAIVDIPMFLLAAYVAQFGTGTPMIIAGVAAGLVLLVFPIKKKHLKA